MTTPLIIAAAVYLTVGLAAAAVAAYAHALSCRLSGLPPNWGGAGPIIGSYVVAWPFILLVLGAVAAVRAAGRGIDRAAVRTAERRRDRGR